MPFDSAALQALIDGGPGVISVTGDYVLASAVSMRPGVHLKASNASITQAANANLTALIEFNTCNASNSSIEGFTLDGNRSGNIDADTLCLLYVGSANNVTIKNNTFRNIPGLGVYVTSGQYPKIIGNDFQNVRTYCIAFISPTGSETAGEIRYNTCSNQLGQHVFYLVRSNGNRIEKNRIYGTQIRGACWSNQHSVSFASGGDFAGLQSGGFLIGYPAGNYVEGFINSVNSPTDLTIRETLPAANYTFIAGTGDLINVSNSYRNTISGNILTGGAGGGIVIHNFNGGTGAYQMETVIENNEIYYIGGSGISVQGKATSPVTLALDTTIQNNRIVSCGMGGDAVRAVGRNGISLIDFSGGILQGLAIVGNRIQNEIGSPTMLAAIYSSNVPAAQVYINNPLTYAV